ncbi:hypothetical protein URH17368_2900 [Alicyclobacillus hesperidum URH17-3-68]|nr:hypothetical protein URH17368_2900 [Alicyclobacillus hesperidum URH17-3-68]
MMRNYSPHTKAQHDNGCREIGVAIDGVYDGTVRFGEPKLYSMQ